MKREVCMYLRLMKSWWHIATWYMFCMILIHLQLRTWFGIAPVNKLVSLMWLLWALKSFRRFTLHYNRNTKSTHVKLRISVQILLNEASRLKEQENNSQFYALPVNWPLGWRGGYQLRRTAVESRTATTVKSWGADEGAEEKNTTKSK